MRMWGSSKQNQEHERAWIALAVVQSNWGAATPLATASSFLHTLFLVLAPVGLEALCVAILALLAGANNTTPGSAPCRSAGTPRSVACVWANVAAGTLDRNTTHDCIHCT